MFDPRPALESARDDYNALCKQAMREHQYAAAKMWRDRRDDIDAFIDAMPTENRHASH